MKSLFISRLGNLKRPQNALLRFASGIFQSAASPVQKFAAAIAAFFAFGFMQTASAQSATPIDVSPVISVITAGVTTVSAIGIAVLSLVVTIKLFKYVQRAT